jgi:hypothetical protein
MRTVFAAVGVGFGALAALAALRVAFDLGVPLGPDPAMWCLAAVELREGRSVGVPPLWPALLHATSWIGGVRPWEAGTRLSPLFAAANLGALVAMLRREGASTTVIAATTLAAAAAPDALAFAFQVQPDALATFLVTAAVWAAREDDRSPTVRSGALALLAPALLALVREHGAPMLAAMGVAVAWRRSPRAAAVAIGVLAAAAVAAILEFDHLPTRWTTPLRESFVFAGHGGVPSYIKELEPPDQLAFTSAWRDGSPIGVWRVTMARLIHRNGVSLLLIAAGLVGWRRASPRAPIGVWAAFSPLLLLLLVWSQRRHTGIVLPIAWAGIGLGAMYLGVYAGRAMIGAALISAMTWRTAIAELRQASIGGREALEIAGWLNKQPGTWMLGGLHNEVNLSLEWTRHNPPLPQPGAAMPVIWDGPAWRTLWVAPAMPPPFVRVHRVGGLAIWRLEPNLGQPRPCAEAEIVRGPTFANGEIVGRLDRACQGAARQNVAKPRIEGGSWDGQPFVPHEGE